MKTPRFHLAAILAASTIMLVPAAFAEFYVGGAIGQARINERVDGVRVKDDSTSWRIYGGYDFNEYIGIEGGYLDIGEISDTVQAVRIRAEADGWTVAAVGNLPLSERWSVHAKAGYYFWDGRASAAGVVSNDSGSDPFVGLGVAYNLSDNAEINLGVDYYNVDDLEPLIGAIGFSFRF